MNEWILIEIKMIMAMRSDGRKTNAGCCCSSIFFFFLCMLFWARNRFYIWEKTMEDSDDLAADCLIISCLCAAFLFLARIIFGDFRLGWPSVLLYKYIYARVVFEYVHYLFICFLFFLFNVWVSSGCDVSHLLLFDEIAVCACVFTIHWPLSNAEPTILSVLFLLLLFGRQ